MAKIVKRSEDPGFFPQGGRTKMFSKGHASAMPDSVSGKQNQGSDDGQSAGEGVKVAKGGGSNRMFGKGHAGHKTAGVSGKESQVG